MLVVEHSLINKLETLLILGGEEYPIKIAQNLGLRVLVADSNPSSNSIKFADEVSYVSNLDIDGLKTLCESSLERGFPIKGVLVMGSDIPHIAAALATHLNIPGPSIDTGRCTTNKFIMKERLSQAGIKVPWYALVKNYDSLLELMKGHGGTKFVIKPTDCAGARGVFVIHPGDKNIDLLFNESKKESKIGEVIIEEFIEGEQISTESILWRGKAYTPGFVDRNYEMIERFAPSVIENGGIHPSKVIGKKRREIEILLKKAALALGIFNGVAKGDIVINHDGTPMIIEIASRLSGGDLSESLIPIGCGVNIVKEAIQISLGNNPNIEQLSDKWEKYVANRYFFCSPGVLESIDGLDDIKNIPWLKKFEIWVNPGAQIKQIKYHTGRLGVFIVVGDNYNEIEDRIKIIYNLVKFNIQSNNYMGLQ